MARCRIWQDRKTAKRLRAAGFEAHALLRLEEKHRSNAELPPLFPTYVFVRFARADLGRVLGLMLQTGQPVVTGIMATCAGAAAPVPDAVIQEFLDDTDELGIWNPKPKPKPDEVVVGRTFTVDGGAWTSFSGKCRSAKRGHVELLLNVMGRESAVWVPRSRVTPV